MIIFPLGINYSTEEPLLGETDETSFAEDVLHRFKVGIMPTFGTDIVPSAPVFRGSELTRQRTIDLGDPRLAGWTFLLNHNDPQRDEIIHILRPLAIRRGMLAPEKPLFFNNESQDKWFNWLLEKLTPPGTENPPYYILIVGGPDQVPFRFQSFLDTSSAVGRVSFDTLDDLKTYIEKIIAIESAAAPATQRQTVFFAPDGGPNDATHFSRHYMAEPLTRISEQKLGFVTQRILGEAATRSHLQETLRGKRPALVYTASHGLGAPDKPVAFQKKYNGAVVCQRESGKKFHDRLFSADDICFDEPFLEGAVFFQFACFGYGTPAQSDFAHHWHKHPISTQITSSDFVASLPKRMLAHPRGPIAFIGHIDMAWLHGFGDPDDPELGNRWNPRLKPFIEAIESLLSVQPVGLAMQEMNKRYNTINAHLTNTFDVVQQQGNNIPEKVKQKISYNYIVRNDAQNYMVFGDPAVGLRIPI